MSEKFQNKYRIESARLKNYDYSSNGAYFITIVTKNREHFFGKIVDNDDCKNAINRVLLSKIGKIAQKYWQEIPQYFPFIRLDKMVVMPNHIHAILWIDDDAMGDDVMDDDAVDDDALACRDAINRVSTTTPTTMTTPTKTPTPTDTETEKKQKTGGITGKNNPMNQNNISRVIRWYKGRCTFETNKLLGKFHFAWQPRFHDRIIRNEHELNRIRQYIVENPAKWERDRNNQGIWL